MAVCAQRTAVDPSLGKRIDNLVKVAPEEMSDYGRACHSYKKNMIQAFPVE